ncbi:MAG: TraR/DksA family transcriptional regulator, partial [Blastocatellia bacterium]
RITRDVRHTEQPPEADAEERATAQENDEVLDGLEQKIRDEMKKIQDALHRLDRGDFGVCEVCGRNNPRRRLQTLPYTSRCVACAEKTAAA